MDTEKFLIKYISIEWEISSTKENEMHFIFRIQMSF